MKKTLDIKPELLVTATIILSIVFVLIGPFLHTQQARADTGTTATGGSYTLLEPIPQISIENGTATLVPTVSLTTYIKDTVNLLIALAAAAAVFMIVWGGLQYMTTDSWGGKSAGLDKLWNAVIGLLMVLSTYIILRTVNPALVNVATIPPICNSTSTMPDASGNCAALTQSSPQILADNLQSQTVAISNKATTDAAAAATASMGLTDKINAENQQLTSLTDPTERANMQKQINTDRLAQIEQFNLMEQNQTLNNYNKDSTTVEQLDKGMEDLNTAHVAAITSAKKIDPVYNTTVLDDQYNYTAHMLQLDKVNIILKSASSRNLNVGFGSGSGAPAPIMISMIDPDTGFQRDFPQDIATAKVQALFSSIDQTIGVLGSTGHSTTLHDQLLSQVATTRQNLDKSIFKVN